MASFSRFNFLICSPSSSSLSRSEKHSFLFTFFCFDLKVLDKTGRRKLQLELELEHLKRQTLVTSKMIFFMELVLSPRKSHGQRSLVGCSPWSLEESDTTERPHFHFSLSCIGEGNGNPLQCSCLANPKDGGAWWAADYGIAQSQTRLRRPSSSSSSSYHMQWFAAIVAFAEV